MEGCLLVEARGWGKQLPRGDTEYEGEKWVWCLVRIGCDCIAKQLQVDYKNRQYQLFQPFTSTFNYSKQS